MSDINTMNIDMRFAYVCTRSLMGQDSRPGWPTAHGP